ncbi:hypothetical protein PYW07_014421 [Mythimna separata]|uniref:Protein kinase C-binding protein 1-like n=1 Tax=Mythimna separata TaxID=271217 RepID=A0AAD8DYZ4_MYTSE|nr:hypothetical protein PYW07_014421 [Mythimna separata]
MAIAQIITNRVVMEESTESHMETDVSSTTDDVPETQEVTGSDGNVEMIIVVEKMEDEPSADEENEEQMSQAYDDIAVITPEDKSSQKEVEVPKSPVKSPAKSPLKTLVKLPVKSPIKPPPKSPAKSPAKSPKSPAKSLNIEADKEETTTETEAESKPEEEEEHLVVIVEAPPQQENEVPPSVETQQIEAADSSMEPAPIQLKEKPTQIQKTPKKEAQKPVQKSPMKDLQPSDPAITKDSKQGILDKIIVNGKVQCNDTSKTDDTSTKTVVNTIPIDITNEASNDSQVETMSDMSEKEHKSISRELKSLINSAKESKIISECTQLTSKTRKSRTALDTSSSSLNASLVEPNKIHDTRRNSDMSQKSNCSEKSDRVVLKRSMRSQNPEFVSKVKQFLNSVTGKGNKETDDEDEEEKAELLEPITRPTPPKVKKTEATVTEKSNKLRSDAYCWRCHWVVEQATNEKLHPPMQCTVCPRSFHYKCLTGSERSKINVEKNWVCPECMIVLQAESSETRSPAMKKISLGMLCDLLKHALERMMDLNGVEPFMQPVDRTAFPDYDKYVVHPMDLSLMKDNINEGLYGSTEAFLADAQWILHNSIIFNTLQSKLTAGARALVRSCRAEMGEIEACPECYAAAHARRPTWFTDVCTTPHILFWAKLKGFPYWPAKGMSVNSSGLVDVRFFGAHDRAWVPAKDCFLYSEKDPNNFRTKRQDIIDSMQEADQHIRNISRKYGRFVYPPFKTQFDPTKMYEQLKMMIPSFEGEVRSLVKEKASPPPSTPAKEKKSRSNSKSSKGSFNDGDGSDNEDTNTIARKMADGAEIAKIEEWNDSVSQDKDVEPEASPVVKIQEDSQSSTSTSSSKKRRRSELEEAVITIIESSGSSCSDTTEKRRKLDDPAEEQPQKPDDNVPTSSKTDEKTEAAPEQPKEEEAKAQETTQAETNETSPKPKDDNTRNEEKDKQRVTPIRIALVTKEKRKTRNSSSSKDTTAKIIPPNKDKEKEPVKTPQRRKSTRPDKAEKTPTAKPEKVEKTTPKPEKTTPKPDKTPVSKPEKIEKNLNSKPEKVEKTPTSKPDKTPGEKSSKETRSRAEKRRISRSSRSTNSTSSTRSSDKAEKNGEGSSKEKRRGSNSSAKEKDKDSDSDKPRMEKQMSPKSTPDLLSPRSVKDRLQFDDDTTLAVLARESNKSIVTTNIAGLPTISSVRSLSTTAQPFGLTITKTTTTANTIDITGEATTDSSISTPSSSENTKTSQDVASKLQRLRNDTEPVVGRVGVRAFARMTSPERNSANDEVQVEIKAEPIDLDDADRHMEKMDLMNAFRLRPVNPQNLVPNPPMNLRDVRINKVVVTPLNARKAAAPTATVSKAPEVRPRAKKTFPQPKKPDEGRSELNSKNSMVYIPIQPPMTQAPIRLPRPTNTAPPTVSSILRPPVSSVANNLVNTVTTPLMQSSSSPPTTSATATSGTSVASVPTVHTVPLMTSVNGQWMFSFQPVMSVGAIDTAASPPMVNGIAERGNPAAPLANIAPAAAVPAVVAPAPGPAPPITVLSRTPADNTPGEPPRLQQRPLLSPLDANTPIGSVPVPSVAGPVTAKLNQNAVKMTDFFRTLLEDSLEKLDEPWSQLTTLRLQLEQETWKHQQELKEAKHNHDLVIAEMRTSFDKEKLRAVSEARRLAQGELEAAVKLAKSKQWCANCSQESQFYCCWNTSYCDLPCQRAHWLTHFATCQQRQNDKNGDPPNSPENRLIPQTDLPKSSPAPTLTVGGKLAPSRAFSQDPHSTPKTSIIVSMVEDTSGNQTMKCVGTYKAAQPNQIQPIIINKQLLNNEENANKKVVSSSGGYLIVGAPNTSSVVTPARRTHTIQYYT